MDLGPCRARAVGQHLIEDAAIDDRCAHTLRVHEDRIAVGRNEARRLRRGENRMARQVEFVERFGAEKARAVHRDADGRVFFEHDDVVPGGGEIACGDEACGTGANDRNIAHRWIQYFLPRASHVPWKLIQNDRRIKRTSSNHERRLT